jgi:hypothetical protein
MKKAPLWSLLFLAAGIQACTVCADCTCTSVSSEPGTDKITTVTEVCERKKIRDTRGTHVTYETVTQSNGSSKTVMITTTCDCPIN